MRKWPYSILLLLLGSCGHADERAVWNALREGNAHYRDGDFAAAAASYEAAPQDPHLGYNAGNARYKAGDPGTAIAHYDLAAQNLATAAWRARAHHAKGNAYLAQASLADSLSRRLKQEVESLKIGEGPVQEQVHQFVLRDSLRREMAQAEALIDSTLAQGSLACKEALRQDPEMEPARHDLAIAMQRIAARPKPPAPDNGSDNKDKNKQELSARARALLQRAEELVDQYRFKEALEVLQNGLKEDPSLKEKKEYMDKLEIVTKAAQAQ